MRRSGFSPKKTRNAHAQMSPDTENREYLEQEWTEFGFPYEILDQREKTHVLVIKFHRFI